MKAMVMEKARQSLRLRELDDPVPGPDQVLLRVRACGVCRTDLHILDGELDKPRLPLVPGHEIVGVIVEVGAAVHGLYVGQRVGVPWLGYSCGHCRFCAAGQENLCDNARFTGYQINGGYAEYTLADARYCFPLPDAYSDLHAAPLLCAGLIGYRAYRMAGAGRRLGLYGFGAAAHLLAQLARQQGRDIYAFTRPGDDGGQAFARRLGAVWAGGSDEAPPERLDAAIIFAPVGALVPTALAHLDKGGRVICAGIHMSDIPAFPYELLWEERVVASVANLTREDGRKFLVAIEHNPIETRVTEFELEQANEALDTLREGRIEGAAVLRVS